MNLKIACFLASILFLMPLSAFAEVGFVSVDVDGKNYIINLDMEGVEVQSIEGDGEIAMILAVDVTGTSGTLEVAFDREFFDSTFQGEDDLFFVILDGFDEAVIEETKTDSTRSLLINIPSGTTDIEIIGSKILDGTFGNLQIGQSPEVIDEPEIIDEPEVIDEPEIIDEPIIDEPEVIDEDTTQCGPGTVLKNGECVLDETCGPGTILENGECVLDKSTGGSSIKLPPMSQLIYGAAAALVISFIVIIFLWIISRGSRETK